MLQHVMYDDILVNRMYVSYPYYDTFNIDDKVCLYCYRDNEMDMHDYIDNATSEEYIRANVIPKINSYHTVSEEDADRIVRLFSSNNPMVRLTVYAGGRIDRARVFEDIEAEHDTKRTFIELTGEINAIAMNGLFSLYASALYYLEGAEDTANAKRVVDNYKSVINNAYIYMKRGSAMEFFYMPIADIEKATDARDIDALMESCNNFTEVYLRNNGVNKSLED